MAAQYLELFEDIIGYLLLVDLSHIFQHIDYFIDPSLCQKPSHRLG